MSKQIITIEAPDQVHAFLDLWAMRVNLSPHLSLVDICQSADGKTHTFTLVDAFEPLPCALKEMPPDEDPPLHICPVCEGDFVRIKGDLCDRCKSAYREGGNV